MPTDGPRTDGAMPPPPPPRLPMQCLPLPSASVLFGCPSVRMSQGVEQTVGRSEPLRSEVHEVGTYEEVDTRVGGRAAPGISGIVAFADSR